MKPFKSLNPGMSLIEVVAALSILAVFGSSLFVMQQYLFDRMSVSQRQVIASMNIKNQLYLYKKNMLKESFENKGVLKSSIQEQKKIFTYPDMVVKTITKSDFKETMLEKYSNLYFVTTQADQDDQSYGTIYNFVYIPKVAES